MKITKNMIYKKSEEARELYLVTDNDGDLYRQMLLPIYASLEKKIKKGTYNSELATVAFYHATTAASDKYFKDFGYRFTVTERWTAAADLEKDFITEYELQNEK